MFQLKYKTGDVERILGIPAETVRFLEKKGLVNPPRDESSGYRYYNSVDLNKLVAYKFYRSFEFSLDESTEILNLLSHVESAEQIEHHINVIQQRIAHYKVLLERLKELRHSFKQVDLMQGKFQIEDSPDLFLYYNQVNDQFKMSEMQREVTLEWLSQMPLIQLALYIPQHMVPEGDNVYFGYAVRTKYQEVVDRVIDLPLTKKIPPRKSVFTVIKCYEGERINRLLQPALDFMDEHGMALAGDVIGWIIHEDEDEQGIVRYFEVWLPVAAK